MRLLLPVVHLAMSGFLIVAAGYRIAAELMVGADLDPISVVGGGLGLIGLLVLILASDSLPRRGGRRGR